MSDPTRPNDSLVSAYPNLRPFNKGKDPRRGNGVDAKLRKVRKTLARFDGKAMEVLAAMFANPEERGEALKFYGKYRLPVPTEKTVQEALDAKTVGGGMSPALEAKLAALEEIQ